MEEAKSALAEARRLNPKFTVKSLKEGTLKIPLLTKSLIVIVAVTPPLRPQPNLPPMIPAQARRAQVRRERR
jgi:hypothetical protein